MTSVIFIEQFLEEENRTSLTSDNEVQPNLRHLTLPSVLHTKDEEYKSTFHRFGWGRVFLLICDFFSPKSEII